MKYEYALSKRESELLKDCIGKCLGKFEIAFKEFNTYYGGLYIYNRIEDNKENVIEFRDKETLKDCILALNMMMGYSDIFYIDELVEIDNLISTMCIELYELV